TEPEPEQAEPRVEEVQHSTDEWLDDEMIETISSADPDEIQAAEGVAINAVAEYDEAPAAAVDIEPIKEFDWSPAALITSADEKEIGAAAGFMGYTQEEPFFPQIPEPEAHITEKLPDIRTDEIRDVSHEQADGAFQAAEEPLEETSPQPDEQTSEAPKAITELSPELVEDIVQRVLERLSDRAVREVAQEAVPRIAERLMREALEEDRSRIP
ncbi:MAG: hypothetical protein ACJ73D_08115, partial [Pyrinomonadaceae bacterium]